MAIQVLVVTNLMAPRVKAHPQDLNQVNNLRTMIHSTEIKPLRRNSSGITRNSKERMETDPTAIRNSLRTSTPSTKTFTEQNNSKNSQKANQILTKVLEVHKQMININMDNLINKSIMKIENRIIKQNTQKEKITSRKGMVKISVGTHIPKQTRKIQEQISGTNLTSIQKEPKRKRRPTRSMNQMKIVHFITKIEDLIRETCLEEAFGLTCVQCLWASIRSKLLLTKDIGIRIKVN